MPTDMNEMRTLIGEMDLSEFNDLEKQSFYINAYNILVIDQIAKNYPTTSVKEISGFFDRTNYSVGGEQLTLNDIEKNKLLKVFEDSRFHFVLVCGAKDCPKLWNHSFSSEKLEEQLELRTSIVLNDPSFIKVSKTAIGLSEIFKWNRFEFGGKKDILQWLNRYRLIPLDLNSKINYYPYDWTLNDVAYRENSSYESANNSFRYVTSAAIPKGGIEVKIFNNLYTQKDGNGQTLNQRSNYFTTSFSFLYGKSSRFNIGFVSRYRRVVNSTLPSSALEIFQSANGQNGRQRFTAVGPQIRWAPVTSWPNFSLQSSLTFPLGSNLSGSVEKPFLDWAGPVFLTQLFNDKSISDKFSLFTELDLLVEEIGGAGKSNRVSTPITGIFSWFPKKNLTVYGLLGYSPYLVQPYDYFTQLGLGFKYQISVNFELEILVTDFSNRYLQSVNGEAATYNLGFRYSR
jgi:hypothetical protein